MERTGYMKMIHYNNVLTEVVALHINFRVYKKHNTENRYCLRVETSPIYKKVLLHFIKYIQFFNIRIVPFGDTLFWCESEIQEEYIELIKLWEEMYKNE